MRWLTGHIFVFISVLCLNLPSGVFAQGHVITQYYDTDHKYQKEKFEVIDTLSMVLHGHYESCFQNGKIKTRGTYKYNQPSGIWTFFYENGKFKMKGELVGNMHCGYWEYYYENGQTRMEGELRDGSREGHWKFYFEGGLMKSEGDFSNNIKTGIWNYYYEDGSLKSQAYYKNGCGIYKEFYTSGTVKMEGYNKNGVSDSTWNYYYEDGTLQAKGPYLNGLRAGYWEFYYDNGKISGEGFYSSGEKNGQWTYYYRNGNVSSKGEEKEGKKEGQWKLYDTTGELKGEGVFAGGNGDYMEYHGNGNLKVSGQMRNGKSQGKWLYYYENGTLEGKCDFDNGSGSYTGYYPSGKIKMKGQIVNNNRSGQWELYEEDGSLAGYYKPVYEDEKPVFKVVDEKEETTRDRIDYMKPEYRYKVRKNRYFTPIINEFKGFIIASNPAAVAIGSLPLSFEYYIQERMGYEIQTNIIRDPFFSSDQSIEVFTLYKRGFDVAARQKFYHRETGFGMFYFAHELRLSFINHYFNTMDTVTTSTSEPLKVESIENKIEYSFLVGDRWMRIFGERWMKESKQNGITIDVFLGIGIGYRDFEKKYDSNELYDLIFNDLHQEKLSYSVRLGINFGYVF